VTTLAFARVRTYQFVSELQYSWHREAARAFARVLNDNEAHVDKEPDNLSKLFNVYLKTQALELWDAAGEQENQVGPDADWISAKPTLAEIAAPLHMLKGPAAGISSPVTEERIYVWLTSLLKSLRAA
jgi:hypothetical protein